MIGIFSYVKLSSLKRALRERMGGDGPAKAIYILPSKSNEDSLLDMLRGSDDYFASRPKVWSWQELYNALVPKGDRRRCVDPPDHYLILRYVRDRTMEEMASSGVPVPPGVARSSFVRTLGEAVNEMLLEDIDPELIHDSGHDLLFRLYTGYTSYLAGHGLADNSQLPTLARHSLAGRIPKPLEESPMRWIGFMSFTGAQLALIKRLAELGADMEFFVPDSGAANFKDAASQLGAEATSIETGECSAVPAVSPDIYSQYEYIADEIIRTGCADCGIMAPPERKRALATALNRRGIPWQPRSEVTVDETAIMDVARVAWETHKLGWAPARAANLLRDPAFGVEPDPSCLASSMPEGTQMWKGFFSGSGEGAKSICRLESFCELIARGGTCEELLRGLYSLSGDGEWESRLVSIAGDDFEMDSSIREISSSRLEIAQKIAMMGDVTPSLGEASMLRFAGDDAMEWLREWAAEAAIALPPQRHGVVAVYTSPPPVLASHDVWVISDADATRYPGAPSGHALLDEGTRKFVNDSPFDYAHLPTIYEKRCQKEALFRRLLAMGERVTVAARAATDPSGNPVVESPFLRHDAFSSPHWRLGKRIEATPEKIDPRRIYRKFPRAIISMPDGGKTRVSMSAVDRLLDCPFAYWCGKAARIEPVPEPGQIIDRLALGNVMHGIWRQITEAATGREAGHRAALMSEWDGMVSSLSGRYPLLSDARSRPILSNLKNGISAVADIMDEMMARAGEAGMRKIWTKTEFALPDLELGNAIFSGRADRVDFWAWPGGEGAVVFDYKLGGGKNYAKRRQLASYGATLRKSGVPVAGFCYMCHGDAQKIGSWSPETRGVFAKGTKGQSAGERIDEALERLTEIGLLVSLGKYEALYDSQSCKYCDYPTICRRGERFGDYESPDGGG